MTQNDDDRLATWLADGPAHGPIGGLERAMSAARATRQRPPWLVAANGGTITTERTNRSVGLAWAVVAAVALIGLLIGGLVVGGWLRPQPAPDAVLPSATATPISSASPVAPSPSAEALLGGGLIVAYVPHQPSGACSFGSLAPFDVVTVDPATGTQTLLGTTSEDCSARSLNFQWAPDRARVLMTDQLGTGPKSLDTPSAAGTDVTFICCDLPTDVWQGGANQSQGWVLSPAGDRVAAIHTSELVVPGEEGAGQIADGIVVANIDGSGDVLLPLPEGADIRGGASWSPDQSALVVAACRPCNRALLGEPATAENHEHLYLVPVDGSRVRELTDDTTGYSWTPAWSPDRSTIAVGRRECLSEWVPLECSGEVTSSLVLVDAESGIERAIISNDELGTDIHVGGPVWSRDSTRIAFTTSSAVGDPLNIFVVDADGSNLVDLGAGGMVQWSPDGEWLLVSRHAGESLIELWIMRADGTDARSLGTFLGSFTYPAGW
jgi:Tol biopolymer transport system component